MKNIAYIILTGIVLGCVSCKDQDSIYEEFLVPNGIVYPMPAQKAVAKPGNKRIEISWQNGVDPKVTKANIFWDNYTKSVEIDITPDMEIVSRIIDPIEENTYSFMIHTYDMDGNVSVPIEVMGKVYGDKYKNSLNNRVLMSGIWDVDLLLNWFVADKTEVGVNVYYTDMSGAPKTRFVEPTETKTLITDFKLGTPLYYSTVFKPDTMAIDEFSASNADISYWAYIADQVMKGNPWAPYRTTGSNLGNGLYAAADWIANAEAAKGGNVDTGYGTTLAFYTYAGYPSTTMTNGKLYQIVELEAGTYRFSAHPYTFWGSPAKMYVTASLGDELADVDNVETEALGFARITNQRVYSFEFDVPEYGPVALGFVGSLSGNQYTLWSEVQLWRKF